MKKTPFAIMSTLLLSGLIYGGALLLKAHQTTAPETVAITHAKTPSSTVPVMIKKVPQASTKTRTS